MYLLPKVLAALCTIPVICNVFNQSNNTINVPLATVPKAMASSQRMTDGKKTLAKKSKFFVGSGINIFKTKTEESNTKFAKPTESGAYKFNKWETDIQSYKGPGRHHPITFSIDGIGYVMGGNYPTFTDDVTFDIHRFEPGRGWTELSLPKPRPKGPRGYSYGVAIAGLGYLGFGRVNGKSVGDWWNYNPVSHAFKQLKTFPGVARFHPAMVAIEVDLDRGLEQLIYVGCGSSDQGNLKDWWEYDIQKNSWIQREDLPGPPRHHPYFWSASIGDRVFIYVGFGHGNYGLTQDEPFLQIYKDVYRFDPYTLKWTQMKDFPGEARVAGTQFSFNSRGYILSGDGDDHSLMPTGEMHEYDPTEDAWQQFPPHPGRSRWAPGCFVIGSSVYFTSGYNRFKSTDLKDVMRYSFEAPPCPQCGSLKSGKRSCCATGGSWFGKCADIVVPGESDHTWYEGIQVCEESTPCSQCGADKFGARSCCARGGAWFGKCGKSGDTRFDHTWVEGIEVCRPASSCPKCGVGKSGTRSCCARGGAWAGNCGKTGNGKFDHTWVEGIQVCRSSKPIARPTTGCPACGDLKSGGQSCCARGGAWFGKCGDADNKQAEHTWFEGIQACQTTTAGAMQQQGPVCPVCGSFTSSKKLSCCAPGGSWSNKCGKSGEYTWAEGVQACEQRASANVERESAKQLVKARVNVSHLHSTSGWVSTIPESRGGNVSNASDGYDIGLTALAACVVGWMHSSKAKV